MAIARQRPATAKGIVFMLLEDEFGQANLIVPSKVYEEHRAIVRGEPLILASAKAATSTCSSRRSAPSAHSHGRPRTTRRWRATCRERTTSVTAEGWNLVRLRRIRFSPR